MAGFTRRRLDLDDPRGDLGDFELEEPLDQPGVGAADDDLRPFARLAHLDDVGLEPGAVLVALIGDLLGLGQQGLDLAQVQQRVAVVRLLHDPRHDVALAARVLLVLHVALYFTDPLEDDLLRSLCRDASEVVGCVVPFPDDLTVLV